MDSFAAGLNTYSVPLLTGNPALDLAAQHRQGHAAVPEHMVVELADVEPRAHAPICQPAWSSRMSLAQITMTVRDRRKMIAAAALTSGVIPRRSNPQI